MGFLIDAPEVIHDGCRPPRKALAVALEDAIWLLEAAEGRGFAATLGLGGGIVLYSPPKRLVAKRQGMLGDCGVEVNLSCANGPWATKPDVAVARLRKAAMREDHAPFDG
jgi:hypothetical protein